MQMWYSKYDKRKTGHLLQYIFLLFRSPPLKKVLKYVIYGKMFTIYWVLGCVHVCAGGHGCKGAPEGVYILVHSALWGSVPRYDPTSCLGHVTSCLDILATFDINTLDIQPTGFTFWSVWLYESPFQRYHPAFCLGHVTSCLGILAIFGIGRIPVSPRWTKYWSISPILRYDPTSCLGQATSCLDFSAIFGISRMPIQ